MSDALLRDQRLAVPKRWVWFSKEVAPVGTRGPFGPYEAKDVTIANRLAESHAKRAGLTLDYFTDEDA